MYLKYFGLTERPFSIAPDPNYLFMSARHKEAMAHLSYGLSQGGCFIVLTGEVGPGKTTLCRNLLSDLPDNVDVALILNANINELELLQTICDELKIEYRPDDSQKQLLDQINAHLMATFAENRHTVLIIDEAQLLSRDVLEKIRLLTNLETTKSKLLQIILIGQPELNDLLGRNDLRQLAQRVTARYHLGALDRSETAHYVNFRLSVAGCKQPIFSKQAVSKLHRLTGGIPRKMNVLADHALLSAYSKTLSMVDSKCVKQAANEVFIQSDNVTSDHFDRYKWWGAAFVILLLNIGLSWFFLGGESTHVAAPATISTIEQPSTTTKSSNMPSTSQESLLTMDAESERGRSGDALIGQADSFDSVSSDDAVTAMVGATADATQTYRAMGVREGRSAATSGSVVISEEFLDDAPDVGFVNAPATPEVAVQSKPQYNPNSDFGALLDTSADLTGRISAFRNLGKAWDADLPDKLIKPACLELSQLGVQCSTARSLRQVLRFNRPSILVVEQRDQLHRVILFKVDGEEAQVLVGDNITTVPLEELEARWSRRAVALWRPNEIGVTVLQAGQEFEQLAVVRKHMDKALTVAGLPNLNDLESSDFDDDMVQKTLALQSRYGLTADGKVGNETYLLMNELVAPDAVPVLRQRTP